MRILNFTFRGEPYQVNEQGHIKANGLKNFSPTWVFLGGSRHHWSRHIDVSLEEAFKMPGLLDRCLGWDKDHRTTRQWGGQYYGKLPRIRNVHITEETSP